MKELDRNLLIELLSTLPDGSKLCVNGVANLSVLLNDKYIGYIDFLDGDVELSD